MCVIGRKHPEEPAFEIARNIRGRGSSKSGSREWKRQQKPAENEKNVHTGPAKTQRKLQNVADHGYRQVQSYSRVQCFIMKKKHHQRSATPHACQGGNVLALFGHGRL